MCVWIVHGIVVYGEEGATVRDFERDQDRARAPAPSLRSAH
ncbi:MAG TPA: hypothetical protein VIL04_07600 [Solirubrobacterales bacterium]